MTLLDLCSTQWPQLVTITVRLSSGPEGLAKWRESAHQVELYQMVKLKAVSYIYHIYVIIHVILFDPVRLHSHNIHPHAWFCLTGVLHDSWCFLVLPWYPCRNKRRVLRNLSKNSHGWQLIEWLVAPHGNFQFQHLGCGLASCIESIKSWAEHSFRSPLVLSLPQLHSLEILHCQHLHVHQVHQICSCLGYFCLGTPRRNKHLKWVDSRHVITTGPLPFEVDWVEARNTWRVRSGRNQQIRHVTSPHKLSSLYLSQNKKWWDMFGWLAIQATYDFQFYWGPPVDTICPSGPSRVSWAHPLINSSGTWLSFGQSLSSAFRCFRRWDVEKLICRYVLDAYIKVNLYIHGLHINICMCVSSKRGLLIV